APDEAAGRCVGAVEEEAAPEGEGDGEDDRLDRVVSEGDGVLEELPHGELSRGRRCRARRPRIAGGGWGRARGCGGAQGRGGDERACERGAGRRGRARRGAGGSLRRIVWPRRPHWSGR